MSEKKMRLIEAVLSVIILIVSLVIMLCDYFIPLNFWTHPILNFLFCLFIGFGVLNLVFGLIFGSPWRLFFSAVPIGLALIYLLLQYIEWWIGLIIVVVVWAVLGFVSIIRSGNKTEDIALNASPDYKNYYQRKEEENNKQADLEEKLPEIKSFKED